ncbi:MAG: tetratricopeptide repeat protein [Spirochaetales bacterium]|nr:tetratricopeptide repeat protein [Spirochaetales bacterium]
MKLFRNKYTPDDSDIVYERWSTSFSVLQEHRFLPESQPGYDSFYDHGAMNLRLRQKNLFAWTDDPLYRYENFLLSAEIGIDKSNGYSSAGFLFRRIDETSYYYFLVSNKGHYRLDAVINGSPEALIDWTPAGEFNPEKISVKILADGSSIMLLINDEWVGGASDERLLAGGLSFAGQNYDEAGEALFRLRKITIESRPIELDRKQAVLLAEKVGTDRRLHFAESQMMSGRFAAALIELRKALRNSPDDPALLIMAADCCIMLEMYSEARQLLDRVPEDLKDERYLMCRAGLLYLVNDFMRLRELLKSRNDLTEKNPAALNLLGNAEFSLGNWLLAGEAYGRAFSVDQTQPLYLQNAARAWEKAGRPDVALESYRQAAKQYFRNGDYDELLGMLPLIERLDGGGDSVSSEARGIKAKILFSEGKFDEADVFFTKLIKEGTSDSAIYYLKALIESRTGEKKKISGLFKKAIELEPDYYLYHFKKAEFHFLSGGRYRKDLNAALELAPEEPWVLNLSGQALLQEGDVNGACDCFSAALKVMPDEPELLMNYSEALFLSGRQEDALSLLSGEGSELLNQKGNLYSRMHNYELALEAYEAALSAAPDNNDILLNLAAACIESDLFSRAEEVLVGILEREENPSAYNLVGNLSLLKGEYSRAEAAYRRAVELDASFSDAVCNLAELYLSRERLIDADMILEKLDVKSAGERGLRLKEQVFRKRMRIFSCISCGREWIVPRKIKGQQALQLVGEPPDDMPAGKCSGCGEIYCIGCSKEHIVDGRFQCTSCGQPLKLNEDWMRYLYQVNMLDK